MEQMAPWSNCFTSTILIKTMNIQIQFRNLMQCVTAAFVAAALAFSFCPKAHAQPKNPQNSKGQMAPSNNLGSLIIELKWNGKLSNVTGKYKTVWVSQRIELQARMSDGSAITNASWYVPGNAFAKYVQKTTATHPTPLTVLDENTVSFIWRDREGNVNVKFKGVSRGKEVSRGVNFRVRKPEVTMTSTTDGVNWEESAGLRIGNHDLANPDSGPPTTPPEGIVIIVNKSSDFPAGGFLRFTQVGSTFNAYRYDASLIHGNKALTSGLDNNPEYPATFSATGANFGMSDAPRAGYLDSSRRVRLDVVFTTWLMFRTKEVNSQWVPLRSVNWKGGGQADKNSANSWIVSGQYAQSYPSVETTVFPEWDNLMSLGWTSF